MAKKDQRSKGLNGNSKQNAAKQAAARRSQKSSSRKSFPWLRKNARAILPGIIAVVAAILFGARTDNEDKSESNAPTLPRVDGVAMDQDAERETKTQDFLNKFVCTYRPVAVAENDATITKTINEEGYCHPRLSADPKHRTQRVSSSSLDADKGDAGSFSNEVKKLWFKMLRYLSTYKYEYHGIASGELVMKLPRPLQIWDLDALRDGFIQREFLGLSIGSHSNPDKLDQSRKVSVRHKDTQNPLDSGAFLAVYLLRLLANKDGQCEDGSEECELTQWGDLEQNKERMKSLLGYLDMLPSVEDRIGKAHPKTKENTTVINPHDHPLFWSSSIVQSLFPRYSPTYDLLMSYQRMIESEYDALKLKSDEFGKNVNYLDYLSMRINVLSRAFGASASASDKGVFWSIQNDMNLPSLLNEMKSYETSNFGSSLDDSQSSDAASAEEFKLRSMCPLLDMYNSHPNPNVAWRYDATTSSYLIHAKADIPPGDSIVVSYGKYSDGHLFAKYGYINGDGSSPTEVSLAVFHRMLGDLGLGRQYSQLPLQAWDPDYLDDAIEASIAQGANADFKMRKSLLTAKRALRMQAKELIRYLIFDDGYEECIEFNANTNPADIDLKLLKLRHLIRMANNYKAWTVLVPPKNPDALPIQDSLRSGNNTQERESKEEKTSVGVNANRIVSTCRLLSLRSDDIEGDANTFLSDGLASLTQASPFFFVEKQDDALEYRAMMCVVRLCNAALGRYLGHNNEEPKLFGSREWNAWYITAEEVRALGIIQQTAASEASRLKKEYEGSTDATSAALKVREEGSCSVNYSLPLLNRI